ncbi:T9SS type A sorting domain-containing protein [Gabonia massiliensis]|uniref:T9SS type A sorting domain-containing protein n=1 Tax=Gabonia massiliensis TaxID=1686296 RepID=UPI0006D76678|nr:T9SS type A sorting domain-containing protein [Gabonia massiliensis]
MKNFFYFFVFFTFSICRAEVWDGITKITPVPNSEGVYIIDSPEKLAGLAEIVNSIKDWSANKTFKQTCDINLNNKAWIPIGGNFHFDGIYNGNSYKIDGLYLPAQILINQKQINNYGLFGLNSGEIKNLIINTATYDNNYKFTLNYGAIAGLNSGTIYKCISNANIDLSSSNSSVLSGGIVGENRGKIIECVNTGNISAHVSEGYYKNSCAGGISGRNFGEIGACENKGSITAYTGESTNGGSVDAYAGGISGMNDALPEGNIYACKNSGNIKSETGEEKFMDSYAGGIVGRNEGIVQSSYSLGNIIGNIKGGTIGYNNNLVSGCFYSYTISGCDDSDKGLPVSISQIKNEISEEMNAILEIENINYIWTTDENNLYPYIKVKSEASGNIDQKVQNIKYYIDNNILKIWNIPFNTKISLYSIDGIQLLDKRANNSIIEIPINLSNGIYILNIDGLLSIKTVIE